MDTIMYVSLYVWLQVKYKSIYTPLKNYSKLNSPATARPQEILTDNSNTTCILTEISRYKIE